MYSEEIRQELEEKNIEKGDRIKVKGKEGKLMPKPETGDPEIIVLKLDNGYNIGLEPDNIELVDKTETKDDSDREINHSSDRPDILILHTGGTIASKVSYEEGGVKPAFDPEDLVEMYPELSEEVNVHSKVVAQMLSENMEPKHWEDIAESVLEYKDDYDGIVIGHGTDTMAYTGAALSLMLKGIDTGVMLVGSQRSSDRPSSDASMNLYCASKFLVETDFTGFGICMHSGISDEECSILPPQKARKMHTSRRDAFEPVNSGNIGKVNYENGEIEFNGNQEAEFEERIGANSNIALVKARPGMKPEELDYIIENDYDGVVLEGTGLGHFPVDSFDERTEHHEDILEKIEEIAEEIPAVMASQCLNGRVNMNVYDAGVKIQDAGVISARDMHPELAYVKLSWSVANSDSREEALKLFQRNINGEIQERSMIDE
jgi:glutamyl-tRNA(Gln) amidotransferase subunit D